jgi:hypothetical protein
MNTRRIVMKYKVGDLVMLSAAGKARNQNWRALGGWGIIKRIDKKPYDCFPIVTEWYGVDRTRSMNYKPYELKKFKK